MERLLRHFCWAWLLWRHSCILMQLGICLPQRTGVNVMQHMSVGWGAIKTLASAPHSLECYSETHTHQNEFYITMKIQPLLSVLKRVSSTRPVIDFLHHYHSLSCHLEYSACAIQHHSVLHNYYICERDYMTAVFICLLVNKITWKAMNGFEMFRKLSMGIA